MNGLDILYIILGISALFFVGAVWYVAIEIVRTLRKLQFMIAELKNMTQGLSTFKDNVKNMVTQKIENFSRSFFSKKEVKV